MLCAISGGGLDAADASPPPGPCSGGYGVAARALVSPLGGAVRRHGVDRCRAQATSRSRCRADDKPVVWRRCRCDSQALGGYGPAATALAEGASLGCALCPRDLSFARRDPCCSSSPVAVHLFSARRNLLRARRSSSHSLRIRSTLDWQRGSRCGVAGRLPAQRLAQKKEAWWQRVAMGRRSAAQALLGVEGWWRRTRRQVSASRPTAPARSFSDRLSTLSCAG